MSPADTSGTARVVTDVAVRLGVLFLILWLCFRVLAPFLETVLWAVIIAVAADRPFEKACAALGGRRKLVATAVVTVVLVALVLPAVLLTETLVSGSSGFAEQVASGELRIPPPPEKVAGWPVVGERLHAWWGLASENLTGALEHVEPQLAAGSRWLLAAAGSAGMAILQLVVALIVACFLLVNPGWRQESIVRLLTRIVPERGAHYAELAFGTIESVVQGLIGVAVIQAALAGIGYLVAGIPGAGLWALLVMVAAVVQLPVLLVMVPPILIAYSSMSTPMAIGFAVWCVVVSLIDNLLKPILFGRGASVPTLVIFLGSIGGMVSMGILGLFLGAVLLALGYELVVAWIAETERREEPA